MSGIHQLKWIPWGDEFAPIVTQNENGPCPLLALCNVLILSKKMEVTPGETALTSQQLLDMLGSCLIESTPKVVHVSSQLTYVAITMCHVYVRVCQVRSFSCQARKGWGKSAERKGSSTGHC